MKIDAHSLPDDPEQLKRMLLELQQHMDEKLAEKDAQIHELLQAYNAKLAKEYAKKSEKMQGAGEVFNEAEDILDEHDKALLATSASVKKEKAKPIVDELYQWLLKHKDKMALGEAITYAINQFEKFRRYLDDGRLSIDNNRAERAIKPFVIGRKNWLFSNTCNGAHASAILYSLVETAKANDLVVHDYISTCLQRLAEQPDNLEPLLPWNIKQS